MRVIHFADLHIGVENYSRTEPETGLSTRLFVIPNLPSRHAPTVGRGWAGTSPLLSLLPSWEKVRMRVSPLSPHVILTAAKNLAACHGW